jgi:dihydrofolate synthase/folylpolyglutamate synthase
MNYPEALDYLGGLGRFGMRLGLETTERLLGRLGDPHKTLPTVHVGGTNGKGSTAHALHAIFRAAGLRVGLYTSPHLIRFTERIQVSGQEIPRVAAARLVAKVREAASGIPVTFFEAATAVGFLYLAEAKVDLAVVEVGLGGRLDATNVVTPLCAVITSVGLEHREHLGATVAEIAREKGGIIKGGRPVVTGPLPAEALAVIAEIARTRGAPHFAWGRDFEGIRQAPLSSGPLERFEYRGRSGRGPMAVSLWGGHQVANAAVAAFAAEIASEEGLTVRTEQIRAGLGVVHLAGRFTEVPGKPPLVLDAAHNPSGMEALCAALADRFGSRAKAFVFGVLGDKDHLEMLRALAPHAALVAVVRPDSPRARDPRDVLLAARDLGVRAELCAEMSGALARARSAAGEGGVVVVTGSFYTLGAAMEHLGMGGEPDPIRLGDPVRPIM